MVAGEASHRCNQTLPDSVSPEECQNAILNNNAQEISDDERRNSRKKIEVEHQFQCNLQRIGRDIHKECSAKRGLEFASPEKYQDNRLDQANK
ncbi:MAG: hypothetical protein RMJ48_06690 [Roseiflexaceae bacterium]|nr:hypothetical protein [Roseiflexaceae bacterium]